jgi:hypothetical protein
MKKLFPLVLLFFFYNSNAQKPAVKNSFYVGAGYLSAPLIFRGSLHAVFDEPGTKDNIYPVITFGYQHTLVNKWRIGAEFVYDHFSFDNKTDVHRIKNFMIRGDIIWKSGKRSILYSGLATGIKNFKRYGAGILAENLTTPVAHLYLIGVDFKFNKFLFGLNYGVGASGVLNCVIKYRVKS